MSFAAILLGMFSNWDIRYYGDSLGYYQMASEFKIKAWEISDLIWRKGE